MGLIKAKCTECGSPLQVQEGSKKAKCPHCGSVFLVEDAVNNYNYTYNTTNNINADVLNVINQKDEFIIKGGILEKYVGESDVVVVPKNVKVIGSVLKDPNDERYHIGAFEGSGVSEITLPSSIVEIEPCAFKNCRFLKKINFSGPVEKVGNAAFAGCKKLKELNIEADEVSEGAFAGLNLDKLTLKTDVFDFKLSNDSDDFDVPSINKAYFSVKKIGWYPSEGGELHIDDRIEYIRTIEHIKTLYVKDLEKFSHSLDFCADVFANEIKTEDGKTVEEIHLYKINQCRAHFPYLNNKIVYFENKKNNCPLCGEKLGLLSSKCKKCGSIIKKSK